MSATDDRLEILIGKLLDGEISPAEQRILDRELEQDGQAGELLEQLRVLHECGREIVAQEVRQGGADPQDVFERAWRQGKGSAWRRIIRLGGLPRFAVGLAAGFLLGLMLHFVLVGGSEPPIGTGGPRLVEGTPAETRGWNEGRPMPGRRIPNQITREVEWYGFTDQAGNQWLIEGYREGVARPASYHGGL
jgi:hypothetical protein